ncbi:MAG TPA: UDP-N-acetylmuramate--L-alanine ligase [Bacteroidia bacterium]|nr:UDP-N-acetylmuramate--L-alanine ligase [Bacteroidia bacterium]
MQGGIDNIKHVYLIGIGGIGMSALARYFKASGRDVCGYDKTPTLLTSELISEGIAVHYHDGVEMLPAFLTGPEINSEVLIIYTPAIPKDHAELVYLETKGYRMYKRSEVLGLITGSSRTIAVAGTHGKTTTSAMIAHILKDSGTDCTAFLGGISSNYNTNLLLGSGNPDKEWVVVEADEYDRSFLTLFPQISLITSLDADHLDIYGNHTDMIASYSQFAGQTRAGGRLIIKTGLKLTCDTGAAWTYSISGDADFTATDITIKNHKYHFSIREREGIQNDLVLSWPGRHNVENAVAAYAATRAAGVSIPAIKKALSCFKGVKRRFDYQVNSEKITYIDDYAHHPEELKATIQSVRELYPGEKIVGIFQPHLYSRTRDFVDGFGKSLSLLDELILLDIYPAREKPMPGVSSAIILDKVTIPNKIISSKDKVIDKVLSSEARVILTLGAGDIDQLVKPLKDALTLKYKVQTA